MTDFRMTVKHLAEEISVRTQLGQQNPPLLGHCEGATDVAGFLVLKKVTLMLGMVNNPIVGSLASNNTRNKFQAGITPAFLLAPFTFCTGSCSMLSQGETSHTAIMHVLMSLCYTV